MFSEIQEQIETFQQSQIYRIAQQQQQQQRQQHQQQQQPQLYSQQHPIRQQQAASPNNRSFEEQFATIKQLYLGDNGQSRSSFDSSYERNSSFEKSKRSFERSFDRSNDSFDRTGSLKKSKSSLTDKSEPAAAASSLNRRSSSFKTTKPANNNDSFENPQTISLDRSLEAAGAALGVKKKDKKSSLSSLLSVFNRKKSTKESKKSSLTDMIKSQGSVISPAAQHAIIDQIEPPPPPPAVVQPPTGEVGFRVPTVAELRGGGLRAPAAPSSPTPYNEWKNYREQRAGAVSSTYIR